MMGRARRRHTAEFKARVALEAIEGNRTLNQLASSYGVHPILIARWKGQALKQLPQVFARRQSQAQAAPLKPLYQEISHLEDQLDSLRERLPASANQKRLLVEPSHPILSTVRQCELLGLARSSYYYTKSRA
jgi:putative transposase